MARWQATVEDPASYDYGRYTVLKCGPWNQGVTALQQLALLKGFDLDGLDPTGPDFIHLQVECAKLAFADRDTFYGDPNFVKVPMETLLSDAYNDERRKLVMDRASMELRPGTIEGFGKRMDARAVDGKRVAVGASGAGEPTVGRIERDPAEHRVGRMGEAVGDTVHFDIIDRDGNMISGTPSGGWLHSSPVIPELGFPLGHRAQMFWLDAEHPSSLEPASARARRSRPPWRCATASPTSPGVSGRRPAGPVDPAVLPAPRPCRLQPAGVDRRAGLAHRAFPLLFLARHLAPGRRRGREPRAEGDRGRSCAAAGTVVEIGEDWSEGRLHRRLARRRASARRPLIPAGCRAMRPGVEPMTWSIFALDESHRPVSGIAVST
jgi:gamma-glutamyltranspeptidase/glutathione hydrolase